MDFLNQKNKEMLWELVKDTGIFDKMVNVVSKNKIIEMFEELLLKINNNNLSLTEKNKRFLSEFIESLNVMYATPQETREDLKKHRENLFEERLRLKQQEFRQYIQPPIPPKINFLEKDQDDKFDIKPIDLTEIAYNTTVLNMNEVKEVKETKKRVSFNDFHDIKKEDVNINDEIKEIKMMIQKIYEKLGI